MPKLSFKFGEVSKSDALRPTAKSYSYGPLWAWKTETWGLWRDAPTLGGHKHATPRHIRRCQGYFQIPIRRRNTEDARAENK